MRLLALVAAVIGALALEAAPAAAAVHPWQEPGFSPRALHQPQAAAKLRVAALQPCDAAPDGFCGTVDVPLDRAHPGRGTIPIYFTFDPPRSGPWDEAILVTEGGPGLSVTQDPFLPGFYRDLFDPVMETRGLIMLDQRGVGLSGAIDCERVQQSDPAIYEAVADCGRSLGSRSSVYGTGDVALDIEAVRKSLGIKKLDLYGGSNAGMDIQGYASRFPDRVRSAVLDSAVSAVDFDVLGRFTARATPRLMRLLCARSLSCSAEGVDAGSDLAWLADRLRRAPVSGTGFDAEGNPHRVRVTEAYMAWHISQNDFGGFVAASELSAAARALRAGDATPLLRLAAEGDGPLFESESDDPATFSTGDNFARYCTDGIGFFPWNSNASLPTRFRQFAAAESRIPRDTFGPFSVGGWLAAYPNGPLGPDPCITWPAPQRNVPPPLGPAGLPRNVPALFLTGDLDTVVPTAMSARTADKWRRSRLIELDNSGHHVATNIRFECAAGMIVSFIEGFTPGDTSCARDPVSRFPAVGRFADHAADARQAKVDPGHGDASTALDRRVATVATAAITDAFRRTFASTGESGVGLRGGTYDISFLDAGPHLDLHGVRFANDVAVSGGADYPFDTEEIDATVSVDGPGAEDGSLHVNGVWFGFAHPTTTFTVEGTIGGRNVALTVPAS
jgi:pimeloyl-ACP methyl ester carboxylesterase